MKTVINLNIYVHWHVETAQINQSVLQPVASDITLLGVLNQQRQRLETCRSTSTMANYRTAIQSLSQYLDGDIPLHEFNADLLCGYERWLRQKGICLNTISCYMRSLRSLMVASKQRFMDAFKKVYTGNSSTEKRSVPIGSVLRLKNLPLSPGSFEELARDVFLFSFYAMGMPFVDVAHLKMSQIEDRHFSYKRQKTGQGIVVTLEPPMQEIINRHSPRAKNGYLFPLLQQGTDHEYRIVLGRYNRALHRLAKLSGIHEKLTSYVVRHTWASTAYQSNVDLPVISKALGHTNSQITLTYIREIDDQRLAQANRHIIVSVSPDTQMGEI